MFESFRPPTPSERFRAAGVAPLSAFIAGQLFLTVAPLFGTPPRWMTWIVPGALAIGAAAGIVATLRVVATTEAALDVRDLVWALAAVIASVFCAAGFMALAFPGI